MTIAGSGPNAASNITAHTLHSALIQDGNVAIWHLPAGASVEQSLSFGELKDQVYRVAGLLRRWGVGYGDRVLILVPMSPELYAIMLAVSLVGATCVFLDLWAGRAQVDAACAAAAPKVFFGIPKAHVFRLVSPAFRRIPRKVMVSDGWLGSSYRQALAAQRPDARVTPVDGDDAALIAYTTGSTGQPKAVRRSHAYLVRMLAALNQHEAKRIDEIDMAFWPVLLYDALCHGRTSVIPHFTPGQIGAADPATILDQIRRRGVTLLTSSPILFERLCDYLEARGESLPVRWAFLGGAVVPEALLARVQRLMPHGQAIVVYGSTEVEPVASLTAAEAAQLPARPGTCVGAVHPDLDLKIVRRTPDPIVLDDRGWAKWELPLGEPGEIVVSGPHVAIDYLEDPAAWAANKIKDHDGRIWHRMGDTGFLDAEGRLWLTGRLNHVVETDQGPLFPVPVETPLHDVPGVQRAVLLGMEGEAWIVIQLAPGASESHIRLQVEAIVRDQPIARIVFHPKLPVDPRHNTKVDLGLLRRELQR